MKTRISTLSVVCLISCFVIAGLSTLANADYDYYADRLSREHRIASDVDEWIERGNATITASPRFEDGVRLTAWANDAQDKDNYEFAIASAVYLFEIPAGAQYIEVLVRYRGEPHRLEIEDYEEPIAGRAWIRNTKREATRRGYYDENAKETRYGDTFVLRAKNRSEHIKIPAAGHVEDGWMEFHIVAEGGEQIDVEYLEVSTYRRQPKVRVIQRYTPTYSWRPWHRYTYLYFYDGPIYYATDYDYYLRWSYPIYDHHYLSIRSHYGGYLGRYRGYYPRAYYRYYSPYYGSYSAYHGTPKVYQRRTQLNRWSAQHENTRQQYSRSRLSANNRRQDRGAVRRSVRTTLENHRKQTPATTERVARQSIITQKRRAVSSASTLRQNRIRQSTYTSQGTLSKQRRYPTTTQNLSRYKSSTQTQRTTPLYRRSTTSTNKSFSSSTSSTSRPTYRSTTSSSRTRASSSTTNSSREKSSVRSSSSTSSRSSRTRVSSSSSTKTRTRPTTSSSSSSRSSSSDDDDDDDRSRTTERTKRRR